MGICIVTECIWVVLNPFLSGSGNSSRNLEILKGALGLLQLSKDPESRFWETYEGSSSTLSWSPTAIPFLLKSP